MASVFLSGEPTNSNTNRAVRLAAPLAGCQHVAAEEARDFPLPVDRDVEVEVYRQREPFAR